MSPDERERLARLEAQYANLAEDVAEMKADLKSVRRTLDEARGGWKLALLIGGIGGGGLGAAIVKLFPFVGR